MSDKKHKTTKSGDTARKIWLAGIGAYGKAFSEAQQGFSKAAQSTSKVFEELVQKGEKLEHMVSEKSKYTIEKVSDTIDLDERIAKMRSRLKGGDKIYGDRVNYSDDIESRLDSLEAKLDEILRLLKPKTVKKRKPATASKKSVKAPSKAKTRTKTGTKAKSTKTTRAKTKK